VYVMFLTGLRVGELGGLTWDNIDFENKYIEVSKSLMCEYEQGVKTMRMTTPKTVNSYRKIPFIGEIEEMLMRQKKKQEGLKRNLGGRWRSTEEFRNVVFTTNMGSPVIRHVAQKVINSIVNEINLNRKYNAETSGEEYIEFPKLYPHAIRHTFCSRCFEKGLNPKVVQKIMGHAYYSTTIEIYTHITEELYHEDVAKLGNAVVRNEDGLYESNLSPKI